MVSSTAPNVQAFVQQLTKKATSSGQLRRQDHVRLSSLLLSTFSLSTADRNAINRVFDKIRVGKIKLVD
ncbi:MAG: hypothetical protein AAFN18_13820 [Cyanobacteria bacterium J06554_6]